MRKMGRRRATAGSASACSAVRFPLGEVTNAKLSEAIASSTPTSITIREA
jgi:hypothetical protein